ncbi:MAG: hypothetical protein KA791_06700 [Flavobacteriales bacterium]|nr:hypothetical protein [Flavobacteriales bacterium]
MKTRSIVLSFVLPISLFPASAQEDCNDLVPSVLGYNPLDGGIIDVMVINNGEIGWSYPSFILYDANNDTLAQEQAEYFAIASEQLHKLHIMPGATLPDGSFEARLELWTGFNDSLRCTWHFLVTLCPQAPCATLYPTLFATTLSASGASFTWTITDTLEQIIDSGELTFSGGLLQAHDTVCLPPGNYTCTVFNPFLTGDSVYYSVNSAPWNGTSSPQMELSEGTPSIFTVLEPCIGTDNAIDDLSNGNLSVLLMDGTVRIARTDGAPIGRVDLFDAQGRLLAAANCTVDRLSVAIPHLASGPCLVRITDRDGRVFSTRLVLVR